MSGDMVHRYGANKTLPYVERDTSEEAAMYADQPASPSWGFDPVKTRHCNANEARLEIGSPMVTNASKPS